MPPGESFSAGIPHPSLSPPGNPGDGKLGVGKRAEQKEKNPKSFSGIKNCMYLKARRRENGPERKRV